MITDDLYKSYLQSAGNNLSQIYQNQSDDIQNVTFMSDINYKKAYILTPYDGWQYVDIKYWKHTNPSISSDAVDYYIQFRPHVNYPVGSYIIIPNDTSYDLGLSDEELENPFLQPVDSRNSWWMIVGKDAGNAFVRYIVQQCNWDFKWIHNGKICHSFGVNKIANSYTSGVYIASTTSRLDDLTQAWLPDVYQLYGDRYKDMLDDNRTLGFSQRFMIGYNDLNPKVYIVTKIKDFTPKGIIKLSLKQDDYDEHRDNVNLGVCNYYNDMGEIQVDTPTQSEDKSYSKIVWKMLNANNELIDVPDNFDTRLYIGRPSYFKAVFYDSNGNVVTNKKAEWRIELDNTQYDLDNDEKYYVNLLKVTSFEDNTMIIRPSKANSIKGKYFIISVSDSDGNYTSSTKVEVADE